MTNTSLKKWNKESLYSFTSLVITTIIFFNLEYLLGITDTSNRFVEKFDEIIFSLSDMKWTYASLDIWYWLSIIIPLVFLILSLYFGIKSIPKTSKGKEKGRMLSVISLTLITAFLLAIVLLTIFDGF